MKSFKKIIAVGLTAIMLFQGQTIYAWPGERSDDFILSDPVADTFVGRQEGAQLINNLQFTDMPADAAAQDAIIRSGVYNMLKGDGPQFRPNAIMSNQEALAFVLRAANREAEAIAAGAAAMDALPLGANAQDAVYLGFLALARNLGLITVDQFGAAFDPPPVPDMELPEGTVLETFRRTDPVTREVFADWLFRAVTGRSAGAFVLEPGQPASVQSIYGFNDWRLISPERLNGVEMLARTGVMRGSNDLFRPRDYITRMEAAWAGRALDSIFHSLVGLERRFGTVGVVQDAQALAAHYGVLQRDIRIRRDDGQVDILSFSAQVGGSPQAGVTDAVVLREGTVGGLGSLRVGDPVEYIVHPASGTVLYAVVTGGLTVRQAMGRLQIVNYNEGTATFLDEDGRAHTYAFAQGLLGQGPEGPYVRLVTERHPLSGLPYGSLFAINLVNNLITELRFAGNIVLQPEMWGVVIANNPMMGYLTIFDGQGHERTFNYHVGELTVQKTDHFDMRDTIGGIHAMFPHMRFNPRETSMSAIEPGNIVSFRMDPADPTMIRSISASTNYTSRYGRIAEFRTYGNVHTFLMQYENGLTSWFTMADSITVRRNARPINPAEVHVGDWARILVNQAVMGPGHVMESVRAMELEGDARHINSIVRGQLTGFNHIQGQMQVQNAQTLERTGWANYRQLAMYNVSGQQIEYFFNGRPVTLSYVQNNLRHSGAEVYIALENHHGGERIRMMSFRTGRDELLNPDTVVGVDGHGGFHVLSNEGLIQTDAGTIVRRNGRLVDGRSITPWDYARIALSGLNNAAVVDINPAPDFAGVMIARGRVYSVDQGNSFRVQSIALFDGTQWRYTPIQREFAIDHNTLFLNDSGLTSIDDFIDFGPDSVFFNVYNIVIDGTRAARVMDAPYANQAMRGIIHAIDGDTISLRYVHFHDGQWARQDGWGTFSGRWIPLSVNAPNPAYGLPELPNSSVAEVTVLPNSIVVDRNQLVGINQLRVGDQVRIMTDYRTSRDDNLDRPDRRPPNGVEVDGFVIMVER